MMYVDIPSRPEFKSLVGFREDFCVSIYLEITPLSHKSDASRIALKNACLSAAELAAAARPILDEVYLGEVEDIHALFELRTGQLRTATDIETVARAATVGAIESLMIDVNVSIEGGIDEVSGAVSGADASGANTYDIVDEIAGRAFSTGAELLGVRAGEMPGAGPVAAILRYPL